jgi:hypothetical protein
VIETTRLGVWSGEMTGVVALVTGLGVLALMLVVAGVVVVSATRRKQ